MHAEHPFAAAHSQRTTFPTDALREALARLGHGLGAREPFLLVTGDAGTGKTTLVREATELWGDRATVVVLTHPTLTRAELVEEIARRLGAEPTAGATTPQLIACLQHALADVASRGRTPVLVFEDAHRAADELFDELRLLVNSETQAQRGLEVVLVGPPALERRLAGPALAAIRERVSVECRVAPLTHKETRQYLYHRVRAAGGNGPKLFPRRTCSEIHDRTGGVPRAVNTLAAGALRRSREAGVDVVTHDHVRAASDAKVMPLAAPQVEPSAPESAPIARPVAAIAVPEAVGAVEVAAESGMGSAPEAVAPDTVASETVVSETAVSATITSETLATVTLAPEILAPEPEIAPARALAAAVPADLDLAQNVEPLSGDAAMTDPRVRQWVSRFVGNQGPPRIGAAFSFAEFEEYDERGLSESPSLDPFEEPRRPRRASAAPRPRPRNRVAGPAFAILVFAVAALGIFLLVSRRLEILPGGTPVSSASATAADRHALVPSGGDHAAGQPPPADSTLAVVNPVVASPSAAGAHRTVTPPADAELAASGDTDRNSPSRERHGLEVGTFLDPEAARRECDRLAAQSGLQAWVVAVREYGGESHRVVLGVFSTTERAEASANTLLKRGLVTAARVVPLPPRRARR